METRDLESRIATLRAQVRRLLAVHGLGRVAGATVPLVLLACLVDWLAHVDAGVRLTFLVALAAFASWQVYRHVVVPLVVRFDDLAIALRIEQRWPGLNDRLASTVQFLRVTGDGERYGSRALREATVRQTLDETRAIDFREAIEPGPARRAVGLAAAAVAVSLAFVAADPASSRTAARRLFLPFGGDAWPQQTHLALLDKETPRKVARGEPFTLAVAVARGDRVPSSARATYRFEDGESHVEPLRSVEGGVFRGRIEAVEKSFTFSVAAGDDSTSVRNVPVKVVPPPAVKDLTIRLVPPDYARLEPVTLAPGKAQVKAVEGTRVELDATATKPIGSAGLRLGEKAPALAVRVDRTGLRLTASFTLSASNPFWFELVDTEGFRNREAPRYDARSVPDEPPRVVIEEPVNDRDIPAQAVVPVAFTADDDYGLQSARLVYKAASGGSEPTREVVLPLWDPPDGPDGPPVRHQTVRYSWDIAPLKLPPGSVITFHADARDSDTLRGPKLGKSREVRLRVVTDQEVANQLDDARRAIREDVESLLAMQNQARTPVDEAIRTLDKTGDVPRPGRENLKNAEMIQRQVSNRVTNKADGLQEKVDRFLDDLKNFRLSNPDARKQMQDMRAGIDRIRDNHLEPAEQGLTRSTKSLDADADADRAPERGDRPEGRDQAAPGQSARADRADAAKKDGADRAKAQGAEAGGRAETPKAKPAGRPEAGPNDAPAEKGQRPDGNGDRAPDRRNAAGDALAEARDNQKAIADELEKMLDGLREFETIRSVAKDAQNLLKEQEQVMKQTSEAAARPEMMGKTPDQLSPEEKADLANLAARQANVGKEARGLQDKLKGMAERTSGSDPATSEALKDAAEQLGRRGTAGKAGEAADQLEKNQMGAARGNQEKTRQDLKDLVDAIKNRRERELSRLVKEVKQAESDLAKLRRRQTQNLEKTRAARNNPDAKAREAELKRLAKEQAEIRKELERQLKRLAKLNAEQAAQAGARASGKMGQAQQGLDQGDGEQADQQQEDALADLEEAQDELNQARREAEEQLAMEQFSKMGDQLRSLAERQEKVAADTASYEDLRAKREGKLTIAQRAGVRGLAGVQEGLKDETSELIERLDGAPVFSLTLKRAGQGMDTAAQRLQSLKTDETTQRAAKSAAARFRQLLDALKPDKPKDGQGGGQQGGGGGGGGQQGGGGDGIPATAQLKMLKSLQQEINERTDEFDELKRRGKDLTPDQAAELERLQSDQGTLADIVRDLTRPKTDEAEE